MLSAEAIKSWVLSLQTLFIIEISDVSGVKEELQDTSAPTATYKQKLLSLLLFSSLGVSIIGNGAMHSGACRQSQQLCKQENSASTVNTEHAEEFIASVDIYHQ